MNSLCYCIDAKLARELEGIDNAALLQYLFYLHSKYVAESGRSKDKTPWIPIDYDSVKKDLPYFLTKECLTHTIDTLFEYGYLSFADDGQFETTPPLSVQLTDDALVYYYKSYASLDKDTSDYISWLLQGNGAKPPIRFVKGEGKCIDWGEVSNFIKGMDYNRFLNSYYWQSVATMVKKKAGNKCMLCGSNKYLNAHHRTYEHHGDELHHLDDLVCLCRNCHSKFHDKLEK